MKTVKDVVAFLIAKGDEQSAEAAEVLMRAMIEKEIENSELVAVAVVGKDYPPSNMSYVMVNEGIDLQEFVHQTMYARRRDNK